MVIIPNITDGTADYTMQCVLDGTLYGFRFAWNARDGAWFMTLRDAKDVDIISGKRVAIAMLLLRGCVDARRPPGDFIALDTSGADEEAGLTDLGGRVVLCYVEAADLP